MERNSLCKTNLRQQHNINNNNNNNNNSIKNMKNQDHYKVKGCSSWDFQCNINNNTNINGSEEEEGDLMQGAGIFSWPPRSYTCSFCKREFRSAQALGGHMNVHRRDRARLRHYSPPPILDNNNNNNNNGQFPMLNLNLGPNPSSNSNPSSNFQPCTKFPHLTSKLSDHSTLLAPLSAKTNKMKKWEKDNADDFSTKSIRPLTTDFVKINNNTSKEVSSVSEKGGCINVFKKAAAECVRLDLEIGLISQNYKEELDLELRLGYV